MQAAWVRGDADGNEEEEERKRKRRAGRGGTEGGEGVHGLRRRSAWAEEENGRMGIEREEKRPSGGGEGARWASSLARWAKRPMGCSWAASSAWHDLFNKRARMGRAGMGRVTHLATTSFHQCRLNFTISRGNLKIVFQILSSFI